MYNLCSEQLLTEDVVKIKYASLMYLFKRKTAFFFKFTVTELTMSDRSPEEMDQWVWQFPILPMAYLRIGLLQSNFARSKFSEIGLYWMNCLLDLTGNFSKYLLDSVKQTLVHCKFRVTSGCTSLNTAIRLLCFETQAGFLCRHCFGHGKLNSHGSWRNICWGYCSHTLSFQP